ncbi:unnamed protein product, partial [Prunus brigantina]
MAAVSEFESVQRLMVTPTLEPLSSLNVAEVWCPPRIGFVKINTDAAWKKESSMAAEGRAALRGLKKAIQNDFKKVVMESDSKGLVDGVGGKQGNKVWTIFPLLMEIRKLSSRFESLEWRWVPCVMELPTVAGLGSRAVALESWVNRPPVSCSCFGRGWNVLPTLD